MGDNDKNIKKKIMSKAIKKIAKKIAIGALIAVIPAALFWAVIEGLLDELSNSINNLGSTYTSISSSINSDLSEGINITDDKIEQLISVLQKNGISLQSVFLSGDTLGLDETSPEYKNELYKYLRQFLLAQVCTQYPDFGITEDETHYNGIIKIRRAASTATSVDEAVDMTYVKKDKFEAMVEAVNTNSLENSTLSGEYETDTKNVDIDYTDGTKIKSTIIAPAGTNETVPLVVMCHGFTGAKEGDEHHFTTLGTLLASNGIATITIDFPGCGQSDVDSLKYTLSTMQGYVDTAIAKMKSDYNIDESKIGIVGHSMGGRVASLYLDKVSAAALWAPANGDGLSGLEFLENYQELNETAQANGSVSSGWDYASTAVNFDGKFTLSNTFFNEMSESHPNEKISSFSGKLFVAYDSEDRDGTNNVISPETVQSVKSSLPSGAEWKEYEDNHNFINTGSALILDTANFLCNAFLGHDAGRSTDAVNLLDGYTLEQLRNLIQTVYTIDNNGNLYFTNRKITDTTSEAGTTTETTTREYVVTVQSVNYKDAVEKYSMPMQASLALCEGTQNPQYVYEFIDDFVRAGHIDITIMDSLYVDTHNSWYDYQYSQRVEVWTKKEITTYDKWDTKHEYPHTSVTWPKTKDETTNIQVNNRHHNTIIINTIESTAKVTDVDTWMAKVNFEFSNQQNMIDYPLGEETVVDNNANLPDSIPASSTTSNEDTKTTTTYSYDTSNSNNWCRWTQTQNIVHNEWVQDSVEVDEVAIDQKAQAIVAQWDEQFSIPNSTATAAPGPMIKNNEGMFLEMLNNESTQKQQEIFKNLVYIYTNGLYGSNEKNNDIYKDNDLKTVTNDDIIVNVTKSVARLVLSKDQLKTAIKACYSGQAQENLLDALDAFYSIQQNYKVNGTFAIAVTIAESSGGTNWAAIDEKTHNWMSVQGSFSGNSYTDGNGTKWRKYTSFSQATRDFGKLIKNNYFSEGRNTVKEVIEKYNPGGADAESDLIIKEMLKMYSAVGVILDDSTSSDNNSWSGGNGSSNGGSSINGENGDLGGNTGVGFWNTYTKGGKTYKLYYQNYMGTYNNWGTGTNVMCVATAYAIVNSAAGGGNPLAYWQDGVGGVNGGLSRCSRDQDTIMNYVDSGNPVVVYSYFGNAFYGSPHAIVLLDARNTSGTNEVFVVNPYYTPNGSGGQKAGGWMPLSTVLGYPQATTNAFGSCGVLLR